MYCPKCRAEYREGFTECSDCRVPLVWELPPEPEARGDPDLEWVTVLESNDPLVIGRAKDSLEEAGIPYYLSGDEIGRRHALVGPHLNPWRRILVGSDRETEALELLQPLEEEL